MGKRSRNMCPKCEEQRMVPLLMVIWICPKCGNHNLNMGLYQRKSDKMVLLNLTKKEAENLELALEAILSTGGNENLQSIADKLN